MDARARADCGAPRRTDRKPLHRDRELRTRLEVLKLRAPKLPAPAEARHPMEESEADVLAYGSFTSQPRTKPHSTNPRERPNMEVKRRADVVGIFPNEDAIVRLIGAVLFERNDEWLSRRRSMQVEAFAQIDAAQTDPLRSITTQAA